MRTLLQTITPSIFQETMRSNFVPTEILHHILTLGICGLPYHDRYRYLATTSQVGRDWGHPSQSLLWKRLEFTSKRDRTRFVKAGGGSRQFKTAALSLLCPGSCHGNLDAQVVAECQGLRKLSLEALKDAAVRLLEVETLSGLFDLLWFDSTESTPPTPPLCSVC